MVGLLTIIITSGQNNKIFGQILVSNIWLSAGGPFSADSRVCENKPEHRLGISYETEDRPPIHPFTSLASLQQSMSTILWQATYDSDFDDIFHCGSDQTLTDSDQEVWPVVVKAGPSKTQGALHDRTKQQQQRFAHAASPTSSDATPEPDDDLGERDTEDLDGPAYAGYVENYPRAVECRWKACRAKLASIKISRRVSNAESFCMSRWLVSCCWN